MWKHFEKNLGSLTINERVKRMGSNADENYAKFLLRLGVDKMEKYSIDKFDEDGKFDFIEIPPEFNIISKTKTLDSFIHSMFPNFQQNEINSENQEPPIILTPLNAHMHSLNLFKKKRS